MEYSLKLPKFSVTKQTSTDTKKRYIFSDHHGLKLEFNKCTTLRNSTNSWKLNSKLFNFTWVKKEMKKEIKFCLEFNENEGTIYPNLWDTMKAEIKKIKTK